MTIADHCLSLLRERSPRSPEELGALCAAAGVTRARDATAAVRNALSCHSRTAPVLDDRRYGFTPHIIAGSWFTTRRRSGDRLVASFDTALVQELVRQEGLPLLPAGALRRSGFADGLHGPPGWLPPQDDDVLLGVRMTGGGFEVQPVELADDAAARGDDLAARLRARVKSSWWRAAGLSMEHDVWTALVRLLVEEPDLLREPVAPLSDLLPDLAYDPRAMVVLGEPLSLAVPLALQQRLQQQAEEKGAPIEDWLTGRLEELAQGLRFPLQRWSNDEEWDVEDEPEDDYAGLTDWPNWTAS